MFFIARNKVLIWFMIGMFFAGYSYAETIVSVPETAVFELYDIKLDNGLMLFESADVYFANGRILLPAAAITSVLEMNITYDQPKQRFTGNYNNVNANLDLFDPPSSIDWDIILLEDSPQIFVDVLTLGVLINAKIEVDIAELVVVLTSLDTGFPIQTRIDRSNRNVLGPIGNVIDTYSFLVQDQYRFITPPSGNVNLSFNLNETKNNYGISLNTFNDLLYHSANLSLSQNSDSSLNKRLTLSRDSSNDKDKLVGDITRYSFGDVSAVNNGSNGAAAGVGLVFSNFEDRYNNNFGRVTIDEVGNPNWAVELYQSGFLIDTGVVGSDGRIRFENVNLNYGSNRFEIKSYGDFGETETLIRDILIGQNLLQPGLLMYNAGILDNGSSLLNNNNIFNREDEYAPTVFFQGEYGLSNKTSLGVSTFITRNMATAITEQELAVSITRQLPGALLDFNLNVNESDVYSFNTDIIGRVGRFNRYRLGFDYRISDNSFGSTQIESDRFSLSGNFGGRIGLFDYDINGKFNGATQTNDGNSTERRSNQLNGRLSWGFKGLNFSNKLIYQNYTFDLGLIETNQEVVTNQIAVSARFSNNINFRSTANFNFSDSDNVFTSIDANIAWNKSNRLNINTSITYFENKEYRVTNSASWRADNYNVNFGASFSSEDDFQANLGISFSLDYDYYQDKMSISSNYTAASGTLDILNFIDNNQNAIYDEYDEALESVAFGPQQQWQGRLSDKNGHAYLPGIAVRTPLRVKFDSSNTRARHLTPIHDDFRFYSHAGGVSNIAVPFNYNTEIEGFITIEQGNKQVAAIFIPLQILDEQGNVIKETLSDYENYYLFDKMWPGKYQLRIEPSYLDIKGLKSVPEEIIFHLTGADDYQTLEELVITPIESDVATLTALKAIQTNNVIATTAGNVVLGSMSNSATSFGIDVPNATTGNKVEDSQQDYYFGIQFGAYSYNQNCEVKVNELKSEGISNAYYHQGNSLCKVFVGKFNNKNQAVEQLKILPTTIAAKGFVRRVMLPSSLLNNKPRRVKSETNTSRFFIQFGAYTTSKPCDEKLQQAKNMNFELSHQRQINSLCKVFSGQYKTRQLAQLAFSLLSASVFKGAFIVRY